MGGQRYITIKRMETTHNCSRQNLEIVWCLAGSMGGQCPQRNGGSTSIKAYKD
jgi:hypothetical protein